MIKAEYLKPGQLVLYTNGATYEIGKVKRIADDHHAFIWYSEGDTAEKTSFDRIFPIRNAEVIKETSLGGTEAMFDPIYSGELPFC